MKTKIIGWVLLIILSTCTPCNAKSKWIWEKEIVCTPIKIEIITRSFNVADTVVIYMSDGRVYNFSYGENTPLPTLNKKNSIIYSGSKIKEVEPEGEESRGR